MRISIAFIPALEAAAVLTFHMFLSIAVIVAVCAAAPRTVITGGTGIVAAVERSAMILAVTYVVLICAAGGGVVLTAGTCVMTAIECAVVITVAAIVAVSTAGGGRMVSVAVIVAVYAAVSGTVINRHTGFMAAVQHCGMQLGICSVTEAVGSHAAASGSMF